MRPTGDSPRVGEPESSSQASHKGTGRSTPGPGAESTAQLLVLHPSPDQQEAERFSESLPLHLCNGCDGCGMRCTEGVRMTRSEFLRIEQFLQANPAEAARVQAQDKSIPGWPVTMYCQFRDTEGRRCSIYPARPVICRLFGHTQWLPCPLEIIPLQGQEAMDVYQRYAREEIRSFDEWRDKFSRDELSLDKLSREVLSPDAID